MDLGSKVKCRVTGFEGIAVAYHKFLNGCERITVQAPLDKEGKMPDEKWFDIDQLEVTGKGVSIKEKKTGGPTGSTPPRMR